MSERFILDDLRFYVDAFRAFGHDVTGLLEKARPAEQMDLDAISSHIDKEFQEDADHQYNEWILKDRALDAIPLMESDGVNIDEQQVRSTSGYQLSKLGSDEPFINLIKTNRDRITAQLQASSINIKAFPEREEDAEGVQSLNGLKRKILKNNNFRREKKDYVNDGVTYGSGVGMIHYGEIEDSPDIRRLYRAFLVDERNLTIDQWAKLKRAIFGHKVEVFSTFELIRYRGARGPKSADINNDMHRWTHRVQQRSVPKVRRDFPEFADQIVAGVRDEYERTNPYSYNRRETNDTVTQMDHWIRFPVKGEGEINVIDPATQQVQPIPIPVKRNAVARITRIHGVGIVDMEIDRYHHNMFPLFQWNYEPSHRHSCGIGIVKYGRDPQVIHDILHTGMMDFFDTMSKGGGFVDARLGLTRDDLEEMRKEGTYLPIDVPDKFSDKSLKDFIVDTSPSSFPSVYAELMSIHSEGMDMAMSVPNAFKGIQEGSSGRQEEILNRQARQVHTTAVSNFETSLNPFAVMLYSNLVQFERDPYEFYVEEGTTDNRKKFQINKPQGYYLDYDFQTDTYQAVPYGVTNDIQSLLFDIQVGTRSVVPSDPHERAAFMTNFFERTLDAVRDPLGRIWIDQLNSSVLNIPEVGKAIDKMDEREQRIQQQQQKIEAQQQQLEKLEADRKFMIDKLGKQLENKKAELQAAKDAAELRLKEEAQREENLDENQ